MLLSQAVQSRHLPWWCRRGERGPRRSWRTAGPPAWRPSSSLNRGTKHSSADVRDDVSPPSLLTRCSCFFLALVFGFSFSFTWLSSGVDSWKWAGCRSPVAGLAGRGGSSRWSGPPPLVHGTPAICPSSRLSIAVSCEFRFKSLSFT